MSDVWEARLQALRQTHPQYFDSSPVEDNKMKLPVDELFKTEN